MIRITGGVLRGRRLPVGAGVRPTTELARKAAFDILGRRAAGARVLDAAAGSGAYGFEALSRGARQVVFVEKDRGAAERIRASLERLGMAERGQVLAVPVAQFAARQGVAPVPFDLVFYDPPWDAAPEEDLADLLSLVAPGGVLLHERGDDVVPVIAGIAPGDVRKYGRTRLLIYVPPR